MEYISLLEATYNTRDLGGIELGGGRVTKKNIFWRSDLPLHPTAGDTALMLKNDIRTVVDFRREDEVASSKNGFSGSEEFTYYNIPISDGADLPKSPADVAPSYMKIVGAAKAMRRAFTIFAEAENGVMFNCHSGKDRTGVASAILLMLVGADNKKIVADYMESKFYLRGSFKNILLRHPEMNMKIVVPAESYITDFLKAFTDRYGTAERYLRRIGVSDSNIRRLREKFTEIDAIRVIPKAVPKSHPIPEVEALYKGLLIKESITDENILDAVKVIKVELWKTNNKPRYWTAIFFTSDEVDFPQRLSEALSAEGAWYCDFQVGNEKLIVLSGKVLRYEIGNSKQKAAVTAECKKSGIPASQLDWQS